MLNIYLEVELVFKNILNEMESIVAKKLGLLKKYEELHPEIYG